MATTLAPDAVKKAWQTAVEALVVQITEWVASEPGWTVNRSEKEIDEPPLGPYTTPVLTIEVPPSMETHDDPLFLPDGRLAHQGGRLVLEPLGRFLGRPGVVEFYAWPALYRVQLRQSSVDRQWQVMTDSGIPLHQPWNQENFVRLAKDLVSAGT